MDAVLTEIIQYLTGGLTEMATGIGNGLNSLVTNIFIDTSGDTKKLSVFGGVIVIFGGVALAVGLSRFIVSWLTHSV